MEMSRLVAQFTADTTDTALPLTPIGKISLRTTYTTAGQSGCYSNRTPTADVCMSQPVYAEK